MIPSVPGLLRRAGQRIWERTVRRASEVAIPRGGLVVARYERALTQACADRARAEYLFAMGKGNEQKGVAGTLWAAYNGVAEYVDYWRYAKATENRQVDAIWFCDGYSIKARAYTVAERVVAQ